MADPRSESPPQPARRAALKALGTAVLAASGRTIAQQERNVDRRPNILVIMTDQQSSYAMSCVMGDRWLRTPNMDSLAAAGMRFTRAYTPNPLCMPMRTSMMTGLYPHQTGVQTNSKQRLSPSEVPLLGRVFSEAGYRTAYFGKWHVALKGKGTEACGFETFVERPGAFDPGPAAAFLRASHDRPFLAFASFNGPHEICEWARRQDVPGGPIGEPPPVVERPPIRSNAGVPENESDTIAHMRASYQAHRLFPVGDYDEADWRRLSWGYHRLIERVDGFIGGVLAALRDTGLDRDTVVVFLSDHGDCVGAHRWNQKTVFYDESARVPLIISWPGRTPVGTCDALVNTGVDLLPTLCDFAGIAPPEGLFGHSLKPLALGQSAPWQRDAVVSQNHMVQCEPVGGRHWKPHGRMLRTDRYKYCVYSEGERRESLVDMAADPEEMKNLAYDPDARAILIDHRRMLADWCRGHGDDFPCVDG